MFVLVDEKMWLQTHDVLQTRAVPLGIELKIQPKDEFEFSGRCLWCIGAVSEFGWAKSLIIQNW